MKNFYGGGMRLTGQILFGIAFLFLACSAVAAQNGPVITGSSPSSGPVGTQITITGTGFGATQGSGYAYFSSYATNNHAQVVSWSDTQVVLQVTSATGGGIAVGYIEQNGIQSNSAWFTVLDPEIDSITPSSASTGSQITITGQRFGATQGTGYVWMDDGVGQFQLPVVSWSDTQIVVTIPPGDTVRKYLRLAAWHSGTLSTLRSYKHSKHHQHQSKLWAGGNADNNYRHRLWNNAKQRLRSSECIRDHRSCSGGELE
jgi:hypothetical protein